MTRVCGRGQIFPPGAVGDTNPVNIEFFLLFFSRRLQTASARRGTWKRYTSNMLIFFFFLCKRGKLISKHSGQLRENQFVQILLFIFFKEELVLSRGVTPLGESYERNESCVFVWSRRDALALIAKLQFVSLMIIIIQNT